MRCLLISSVAPPDPDNGDAQYTRDLLAAPPAGVEYVTYVDALRSGELEDGPSLRRPRAWRSPLDPPSALLRAAVGATRRRGLLLPDPVRWFRIRGRFDLVHIHCMPVRFLGPAPPVVLSDSAGTFWYWTAARDMAPESVWRKLRRERRLARAIGYLHPTAAPDRAAGIALFVEAGRELLEKTGAPAERVVRIPAGVPEATATPKRDGRTLLFVARDFNLKGGPTALAVLQRVRERIPAARLVVAGSAEPPVEDAGVEWLGLVSREKLYAEVYPRAGVFLYPTRFDCAPLVVMEALAHGIPVVAPDAFALPELVLHGHSGFLFPPDAVDTAARHVLSLLDDDALRSRLSAAAVADFERRFSISVRNELLAGLYADALAS